jgi:monovalent cation/hydrogen antiporter
MAAPFPDRNYILFITFCVILTTLVFQGLTLPFAIRRLCLQGDGSTAEEERVARLDANKAATALLEEVINDDALRRIQRDLDLAEARLTG